MGSGGMNPFILYLGTSWSVVSFTSRIFYPAGEEAQIFIEWEAEQQSPSKQQRQSGQKSQYEQQSQSGQQSGQKSQFRQQSQSG
jgi:hypothetical protein